VLEVHVPRGKAKSGVEHRYAIAHVVEGHPQFGLALAEFVKQSDVLNRNHCLIGEGLEHPDLNFRGRAGLRGGQILN
jgi:hypothetical protein